MTDVAEVVDHSVVALYNEHRNSTYRQDFLKLYTGLPKQDYC